MNLTRLFGQYQSQPGLLRQTGTTPPKEIEVRLFDMVLCFSRALDLLHPSISDHHLKVAYIASCLAEELDFTPTEVRDVLIAAALHDVAAVSSPLMVPLFDHALSHYQLGNTTSEEIHKHAAEGFLLTKDFLPFAQAASAIRFHHVAWDSGRGDEFAGEQVPLASHVLHLADRVAVLPDAGKGILEQAAEIRETISADSNVLFKPEIVTAFNEVSLRESFWLDITNHHKEAIIGSRFCNCEFELDLVTLEELGRVFGKIIDYRSHFTATHSSGVAATAEVLAEGLGMSYTERKLLKVAGYLHDIGKLMVPIETLEKNGKLTTTEMFSIKQHPYFTYQILSMVPGLETVNIWAALHHERLDGKGYPFRLREIPLGSRIIAVADIFTAITEDRPYRKGMARGQAIGVLNQMVSERAIDGDVVAALLKDFDRIHSIRNQSQQTG